MGSVAEKSISKGVKDYIFISGGNTICSSLYLTFRIDEILNSSQNIYL